MRKIIAILLCMATLFATFTLTGCGNREEILKVYNAGEYMDESVIEGFTDWYENISGKRIKIEYKTYSTNEDMYTEIYKKHADYDVVCGSDYIVTRMIKNDLLFPIDREIVYNGSGESEVISSRVVDFVNDYEGFDGGERYSVPYMWGTFGIMYRSDYADLDWQNLSWDSLFKSGVYSGKRYMKNSIRDAYSSASIVANASALSAASDGFTNYGEEYRELLSTVMNDVSNENMAKVESVLKEQKKYLFAYESDDGKDDMISAQPSAYYGLFWSCDAGYAMEDSTLLYYGVPKEGANVWVDSFVIPKFTKNERAAQYFLRYLCEYEQAYLNRDYAGCSSPIEEVSSDVRAAMSTAWNVVKGSFTDYDDTDEDISYYIDFFSEAEGDDFGDMFIEMLFPSDETLARCAVMRDSDKDSCIEMAKMWIRTKAA